MEDFLKDEKTLRILNLVAESSRLSQRQLASRSGLSLGLVNLILKRFIKTGHIKIANLNKKKVEYLLTPKGFWEKASRSYAYISRTAGVFLEYQRRLSLLVEGLIEEGHTRFAIQGRGEIAELLELALHTVPKRVHYRYVHDGEPLSSDELLLDCRLNGVSETSYGISILSRLLQ